MNNKDFEKVFEATISKCRSILLSKNKEYARGGDKLSNFKKAAGCQGITPEQALKGMWIKHIVSVCDYIDDQANGQVHSPEAWDEKILDSLNYLLLLQALLVERRS